MGRTKVANSFNKRIKMKNIFLINNMKDDQLQVYPFQYLRFPFDNKEL